MNWLQLPDVWGTLSYDRRVYVLSIEHNNKYNDEKELTYKDLIEAGIESQDSSKFWLNQRAGTFDLSYLGAIDRLNVAFDNYNLINTPVEELRGYYYLEASSTAIAMTKAFLSTGNAVRMHGATFSEPGYESVSTDYNNTNRVAVNPSSNINDKQTKTYYHITSKEAADKIKKEGVIKPGEFGKVYVTDYQPTAKQASEIGARSLETVISFECSSNIFVPDRTVTNYIGEYYTEIGGIEVYISNFREVGFK